MRLHGLAIVLTGGLTAAAAAEDRLFSHQAWWASCDPQWTCTIFGGLSETWSSERLGFIRITRAAPPAVSVVILDTQETVPSTGTPVALAITGPVRFERTLTLAGDAPTDYAASVRVPDREALAMIAALIQGHTLTVRRAGKTAVSIALAGSAAVLRWVDDRQRRAGGVTALVAHGPAPAHAMPPVPDPPLVTRARLPSQDNLPATAPAAVVTTAAARRCADESPDGPASFQPRVVARLAPEVLLVAVPCGAGAYNFTHQFFLVDNAQVRGAGLQSAPAGDGPDLLVNAEFDPTTAELRSFAKGRGLGDCGVAETHVWDGTAFRLTERREMGACAGVPLSL